MSQQQSPTIQHLFLCAVGRSGTTIFRTSLGLHPDIYYNNRENNVVQDILEVAEKNCKQQSRQYSMVVEQKEYDAVFRSAITQLIWPDRALAARPIRFAAINPAGDQMDYLCQVFPDAKIVCLVRNGIEVVSSRIRYRSFADHEFENHCQVWKRSQPIAQWGEQNPDRFRLFRHEWFYDEFTIRAKLSALSSWMGIRLADEPADNILNCLRHPTQEKETNSPDFEQLSAEEKANYFQEKSERWKSWTEEQRSMFQELCGGFMSELEYEIPWN